MDELGFSGEDVKLYAELFKQVGPKGIGLLVFIGVLFKVGTQYLNFKKAQQEGTDTNELKEDTELVTELLNLNELKDDDQQERLEKLEIEVNALKEGFELLSLKFLDLADKEEGDN